MPSLNTVSTAPTQAEAYFAAGLKEAERRIQVYMARLDRRIIYAVQRGDDAAGARASHEWEGCSRALQAIQWVAS